MKKTAYLQKRLDISWNYIRFIRYKKFKTRNWAYEKHVSVISLLNAFEREIRNKTDLADYLNVPEKFLGQAIEHYREKYGLYYIVDHYTICFEPNFVIIKMFKPI